jgi:hypothetical protein
MVPDTDGTVKQIKTGRKGLRTVSSDSLFAATE